MAATNAPATGPNPRIHEYCQSVKTLFLIEVMRLQFVGLNEVPGTYQIVHLMVVVFNLRNNNFLLWN